MWLSDTAIKRPVIAIVLSLLLCIFGAVSFSKLAVREMPDVESPVVSVTTTYSGASASIMENQVTKVLEDQVTGISGIDNVSSTSRNGRSRITITFNLGWDLTEAVSDVNSAVSRAKRRLPDDADDPIVSKDDGSGRPSIYINLSSSVMDRTQLTDYSDRVLSDRFSLIDGVSSVRISGGLNKVMYVKLNPELMAGRNITASDIINALKSENIESPGGEIRNDTTVMSVRTSRLYHTAEDFGYLVINTTDSGNPVYLKDVAEVTIGAENENSTFKSDGVSNLSLGIVTQSDANPLDVAKRIHTAVDSLQKFLPEGTKLVVDYDSTVFISRSIDEVYNTLAISAALVILVLYIFIGQARATLIPAITVPVSLISAFIVSHFLGFSINLLTLMALVLSIGLVVDDAIVVVENIFHHIEKGEPPLLAAYKGTREVGFAVVATTMVLIMVFLPICFMEGMVGLLFTEFAVTLAMSVLFSSIVALTLTPVMCSKLLKSSERPNRFKRLVDSVFSRLESAYRKLVSKAVSYKYAAPIIIIACIAGSALLVKQIPAQLSPSEDRGVILAMVKGAEGTSYNRMSANMDIIQAKLMPMLGKGVIRSFSTEAPAFGGNAGDQTGFVIIQLEDWEHRDTSAQEALGMIAKTLSTVPDVKVRPMMPGFRGQSSDPVQFVLSGTDYENLFKWAQVLQQKANDSKIMDGADLDYSETTPELIVTVDVKRAAQLGVSAEDVSSTLQVMLGGSSATTFVERGKEYDVYLRGDENNFNSIGDLSKIYMRTAKGKIITLDSVTHTEEVASAQKLNHLNKQKSITLSANLNGEHTIGEALDYLDAQAIKLLPADISVSYTGESKDFKENQSSTAMVFGLALLVTFLVLAAQFESFINPMVVMFTVPMGIFGGLLGLFFTDQGLNLYSQIGMIMLIGMVTKNGILIVEFANQLRDKGVALEQAIIDASTRRLRPILMTSVATVAGSVPLILSTGAGSESRIAVGTVIFFGMAFSSMVTLLVIPAMYRLISGKTNSPGFVAKQLEKAIAQQKLVDKNPQP